MCPMAVILLCNPTNGAQGFQFLHIFTNTCAFMFFFDCSHPHECAFDLHFSVD